ncbi:MAG TPA: site-specific DNA-methyltransferase, partial [Ilumatobacteraceae bacterium]
RSVKQRAAQGLPHESTVLTDDFLALTLDVWEIPPESARRVGHPAPFPVELPEQLIRLYTYVDDLVLDPFMGSGSTLVAASRLGRRFVGYDLDPAYVEIARARVAADTADTAERPAPVPVRHSEGVTAPKLAERALIEAGFAITRRDLRVRGTGTAISFEATDNAGATWWFDVGGPFTSHRGGLQRLDAVWKVLGRASALRSSRDGVPLVILTSHLPKQPSEGNTALHAAGPDVFFDAVELLDATHLTRLASYGHGGVTAAAPGFWTTAEIAQSVNASARPS